MTTETVYPKADVFKRFLALFIDYLIAYVIAFIPVIGGLAGTVYILFRDGFDWDFADHRSLGKKALKLRVVVSGGQSRFPDLKRSFQRNWILAIPPALTVIPVLGWILFIPLSLLVLIIEGVRVINDPAGRRYGDEYAGTQVVEESEVPNPDAVDTTARRG